MSTAAAVSLDVARVRSQLGRVRESLQVALDVLGELYEGRAWVTLDLPSWEALCAQELPELAELFSLAQRRELAVALRAKGLSYRAAGAGAGVAARSVKTWADEAGVQLADVIGLDGKVRASTAAAVTPAAPVSGADRTVALVGKAGEHGLTVRELCRKTGWHHGQASGQLSRLAKRGRVRAVPVFRDGCAAYVL